MIVFEDRIGEIVDSLEPINGFSPVFYWGNSAQEVNAFLALDDQKYPLVYLTSGYEESEGDFKEVERECVFIIATNELDQNKLNLDRMRDNFDKVLNPLAFNLIDVLDSSSISRLPQGYKLKRIANYSDSKSGSSSKANTQIDRWDVIELRCRVVINDKCLK